MEQKETIPELILKFIGIDDFGCPTYQDQFNHLWKDLNLGKCEKPDLYSVTNNDIDGEPHSPIRQKYSFSPAPFQRSIYEFQYRMLSRLQSDCEYFLGYGRRSVAILSGNDSQQHINRIKELWKSFPEDAKLEWLTWQPILDYKKMMCSK